MALCSLDDINNWLNFSDEKLSLDDVNIQGPQVEAQRLIKSLLAGVFTPTILQGWADPDSTPPVIRNIAGEIAAAYIYRDAYSEDNPDVVPYAQQLYNEAIEKIAEIRAGQIIVVDDSDVPIAETDLALGSTDFWPNDTTAGPYFTMDKSL